MLNESENRVGLLALRYIKSQLGAKPSVSEAEQLKAFEAVACEALPEKEEIEIQDKPVEVTEAQERFMKRHGLPTTIGNTVSATTAKGKAYLAKFRRRKNVVDTWDENDFKRFVVDIADEKARASGVEWFDFDENNKKLFLNLFWHFLGDSRSFFPLDKGIGLFGDVGCGKTMLFKIFSTMLARLNLPQPRRLSVVAVKSIEKEYIAALAVGATTAHDVVQKYTCGNWCFDDLGTEKAEFNNYGNKSSFMIDILMNRYDRWNSGIFDRTYFTTNLDVDSLIEMYGERVVDRIGQMSTAKAIRGDSRRLK